MTKIIISCASLGSGGAERVLSILSTPLADEFDSVTYVMWRDTPVFYQIDERVQLISIEKESGSKNELKKMLWFRKFVVKNNPDLLLSLLAPYNIRVILSLLGKHFNLVVAERNDPRALWGGPIVRGIRNVLYGKACGILVQSQTNKDYFKGELGKKTEIIYNPVNIAEEKIGQALSFPKRHRIVSVARLEPQKKHDFTMSVFSQFLNTHPDYILDIYGVGGEKEKLQNKINELGLENNVFLKGRSKNVIDEISDAEMFVLASTHEGMSNAMIEAMCVGLPCICTKVSGAVDLIHSGDNGVLIDINDGDALLQQMIIIADDKDLARKLGTNASLLYNKLRTDIISQKWVDYIKAHINN